MRKIRIFLVLDFVYCYYIQSYNFKIMVNFTLILDCQIYNYTVDSHDVDGLYSFIWKYKIYIIIVFIVMVMNVINFISIMLS